MQKSIHIAPSILAANMAKLGSECVDVIEGGADSIHFDVMDNHYVPNLTLGPGVCESLISYGINAPIDVHLMARPVDQLIIQFAKSGASHISIHPESTQHLSRSLQLILDHGCSAGIALNPASSIDSLLYTNHLISMVTVMTVNPGFGGQTLIKQVLPKIEQIKLHYPNLNIQVDGGVTQSNIGTLAKAGANNFVAGSAIFNKDDRALAIKKLRDAAAS